MKRMKQILTGCAALALLLCGAISASALEVPTETIVRNLDGVQEYIKVYTVSPEMDAADLIEPPFDYNGYTYAYTGIVKVENAYSDAKTHTETVTVETEKKDLNVILEALEPSIEFDDGTWHGVLNLDHTTIQTEAAGHETRSYTITEVKQIDNLNSNDMSFVPSTTVKDGVTIPLKNVDWQVQSTDLVDDVLVPASYVAVATYSGTGWYSAVTGYVSTVEYVGTVTSEGIGSTTYPLTYTGTPIAPQEPEPTPTPTPAAVEEIEPERAPAITKTIEPEDSGEHTAHGFNWLWIVCGVAVLLALAFGVILIIVIRKHGDHEAKYYETEDTRYEDQN